MSIVFVPIQQFCRDTGCYIGNRPARAVYDVIVRDNWVQFSLREVTGVAEHNKPIVTKNVSIGIPTKSEPPKVSGFGVYRYCSATRIDNEGNLIATMSKTGNVGMYADPVDFRPEEIMIPAWIMWLKDSDTVVTCYEDA